MTHNCNLSCKYCYSGRKFEDCMSFETAQKIVEFAIKITPPKQIINFGFFGGEPLLCFDLIQKIITFIRQKEEKTQNSVSLNIVTNGTLLNKSILNFIKRENINLCLSIDGPEKVHNLNRLYKDGRGSYEDTFQSLKLVLNNLNRFQVNAVYSPNTIDSLVDVVSFFDQQEVNAIHLNPNILTSWEGDIYLKLRSKFMELATYYIHCYRENREMAINLIDSKLLLLIKKGYEEKDRCCLGEEEWAFAPSGNIYPCERFIGEDDNEKFCLGNIHSGFNQKCICKVLKNRGNHDKKCMNCNLQRYCMNWCGCTNYYTTGKSDLVSTFICENEKAIIDAAKYVLVNLKDNDIFINHLMKYYNDNNQ
ncbi:MAG: radical SAM protein [Candidatus Thorarchaeota archaeon]